MSKSVKAKPKFSLTKDEQRRRFIQMQRNDIIFYANKAQWNVSYEVMVNCFTEIKQALERWEACIEEVESKKPK